MTLDRTTPPPIHHAVSYDFRLPPIKRDRLDNGIPLYWVNAGVQDVVEVDWVVPAGVWWEEKPSVARAVAALLKNGTAERTAHEINEWIEFYGANLQVRAGNDFATLSLFGLKKHLPHLLPLIFELLTQATFPHKELEIYQQNAIQKLRISLRKCEFVAQQKIEALIFGEAHPYGRLITKEKIEALTQEDLKRFYHRQFLFSQMKMFMSGNIGSEEVQLINKYFGKEKIPEITLSQRSFAAPAPANRIQAVLNDPDGVQSAIRIGRAFPNRHHPDFAPMVVLNTLFGGYFGSRLMRNIREDKGYTYGIYCSLSAYIHGGAMIIHAETGREVTQAAIEEIYKESEDLIRNSPPEEELLLVKNYLLGNMLGDLDGPFQIIRRWRSLILNELTEAHFDRNIHIYKSITPDELKDLAGKYFPKEDFFEVVVT